MAEGNSESGSFVRPTNWYNDSEDDIILKLGNYVVKSASKLLTKPSLPHVAVKSIACCRAVARPSTVGEGAKGDNRK